MDPLLAFWHLLNFAAPALGLAGLLSLALWLRAPSRGLEALPRHFGWLALSGVLVLAGGLAGLGRDGKVLTYAVLVLVMGSVAFWRSRR